MRKTLVDIFTAAREHDCAIVHIGMLAGEAPFIASNPCLGNASAPLIDITFDDYLSIMAEIRNTLVVEHDESLSFLIFTAGALDQRVVQERVPLPPHTISGSIEAGGATAALYYMMDSAGQETTIIYHGLRSFADIQRYWEIRGELLRALSEHYDPAEEDVFDLCYRLDRTTKLATFDLDDFARGRGLAPRLERTERNDSRARVRAHRA
jgi:hypothetical protein